jgi:alanine racemase
MDPLGIVEVDLDALARNYQVLASAAKPGSTAAVVKADAYGLGVAPVARRLYAEGCRHFFVATPAEGVELRQILSDAEIFVFAGLAGSSREAFLAAELIPVLNSPTALAAWGTVGPAAVHIDTGMNRLGLSRADIDTLRLKVDAAPEVDVRYVLTHLACADEPQHSLNEDQRRLFDELRTFWPNAKTSIGNSAGLLLGDANQCDLARAGIALYGANPFRFAPSPVTPVVTVRARILQLRDLAAGATVGYGASFVAESPMRLAVVGIGYADGYLRSLSNCGIAEVAGRRVPVVGRVSMDLVCLDVTAVPRDRIAEGGWATMMGGSVLLEELAALAGTISYELLTALGSRLERTYVNSQAQG